MAGIDFGEVAVMPPITVKLTHSEKKMKKWNGRLGGSCEELEAVIARSDACTNSYVNDEELLTIVFMRPELDRAAEVDAALLAHEATHVAQEYFKHLGEGEPSDELQAYAVQAVTQYLVGEHFKWKQKQFDKR